MPDPLVLFEENPGVSLTEIFDSTIHQIHIDAALYDAGITHYFYAQNYFPDSYDIGIAPAVNKGILVLMEQHVPAVPLPPPLQPITVVELVNALHGPPLISKRPGRRIIAFPRRGDFFIAG